MQKIDGIFFVAGKAEKQNVWSQVKLVRRFFILATQTTVSFISVRLEWPIMQITIYLLLSEDFVLHKLTH